MSLLSSSAAAPSSRAAFGHNLKSPDQRPQEAIQFYPSFGFFDQQDELWNLRVTGRVLQPRADTMRRKLLLRVIRQVLNASTHQLNSPIFQDRVQGFLMITKRGRRIRVGLGRYHYRLKKRSNSSGEFRGTIRLNEDDLRALVEPASLDSHPWVDYRSRATKKIRASHLGRLQVIPPTGPTVITDIDDTIKASNVLDRADLLANTFFEPFEAIDGMSQVFRDWSQAGTAFHYVSSSPWQLYGPLAKFMHESNFPYGSFHLRSIRLRDPEIYGSAVRKYPKQIDQVCLRRLPGCRVNPERFARAFRRVPLQKWRIFDHAEELRTLMPTLTEGWHDASL